MDQSCLNIDEVSHVLRSGLESLHLTEPLIHDTVLCGLTSIVPSAPLILRILGIRHKY